MNILTMFHVLSGILTVVSLGLACYYNTKRHPTIGLKHHPRWDEPEAPVPENQPIPFTALENVWADDNLTTQAIDDHAELIRDDDSTMCRMNVGRLYDKRQINRNDRVRSMVYDIVMNTNDANRIETAWQLLLDYYRDTMPALTEVFEQRRCVRTMDDKTAHVQGVIDYGITLAGDNDYPKVPRRYRLLRNVWFCVAFVSLMGWFM